MMEDAIKTAMTKYYSELSEQAAERASRELNKIGLNFTRVRRIYYIGYIFLNFGKTNSQIAEELGVCLTTIQVLRLKITLPQEAYHHGGDRRGEDWRKQK